MPKTMIAMSGGVDSSAAANIIKSMGHETAGAIMTLGIDNSCDIKDARGVAQRLEIPFYVFDCRAEFEKSVIENFTSSYCNGLTPNPCVVCNKHIKFGSFLKKAQELGYDYVATGHYARVEFDKNRNRYVVKKALDETKDQSYVLYTLTQQQLKAAILPLGSLTKQQARELAKESGFENANKSDSQDICFIPDGDYASFIQRLAKQSFEAGDFVDKNDQFIAKHKGHINYTIGQRKGLGISAPAPLYVVDKDIKNNRVILGSNDDLFSTSLEAENVNFISIEKLEAPMQVKARVRYKQKETDAVIYPLQNSNVRVEFLQAQRAITPGQSVVFYDGDVVVGGGIIK